MVTCHDRKHFLQQLQVVRLVELRCEVGRLERHADLQQQVEPCVRDVALCVPEGPVATTACSVNAAVSQRRHRVVTATAQNVTNTVVMIMPTAVRTADTT